MLVRHLRIATGPRACRTRVPCMRGVPQAVKPARRQIRYYTPSRCFAPPIHTAASMCVNNAFYQLFSVPASFWARCWTERVLILFTLAVHPSFLGSASCHPFYCWWKMFYQISSEFSTSMATMRCSLKRRKHNPPLAVNNFVLVLSVCF